MNSSNLMMGIFFKVLSIALVVFVAWLMVKVANFLTKGWVEKQNGFLQVIIYLLIIAGGFLVLGMFSSIYSLFL